MTTRERACDNCGKRYEFRRATSKFCSVDCRAAAALKDKAVAAESTESLASKASVGLLASTVTELAKAGRENTALGQAAILLAYRLEHSQTDNGSAIASMVKQHGATLAEALKGQQAAANPLDELRRRREQRRTAG